MDVRLAKTGSIRRLAYASAVGTTLEWYDFTIYNIMAALVFGVVFFPSFDPLAGTLLAFSTYAVGYLSRPVGGLVFGRLGDRRGRRFVLITTLVLMGMATCAIGVLPSYARSGLWGPGLLVTLRFMQGAAIGGEWAGAVLLALEHGNSHERGRNGSFAQLGPACGSILGTLAVGSVTLSTTSEQFEAWGWRIPFVLSATLVAFGYWLRRGVDETPAFLELERHGCTAKTPLKEVFRNHWRALLTCIGVRLGPDVAYALFAVFSLFYITTVLRLPRTLALSATMIGATCNALAIPIFASLSDRIGRRPVIGMGSLASVLWVFACFSWMDTRRPLLVVIGVACGMTLHACMYGPQAAFIAEQFSARVRYAGASLAYTLTGIVGGGLAPVLFTAMYRRYSSTMRISLYVSITLVVTIVFLWRARETAESPLSTKEHRI
ncbi:MAG: MFS transporter [Steroidobacteraceae bacterium]